MSALSEESRPGRGPSPQVPEAHDPSGVDGPAGAPAVLAEGRIMLLGQIVGSSNATFLVRLDGEDDGAADPDEVDPEGPDPDDNDADSPDPNSPDPDDEDPERGLFAGITPGNGVHAVYKPEVGERPLHDFPPGLFRRERAAHLLSRHLGWDLVPPTLIREDAPWGIGSVQLFVPHDPLQNYFTLYLDSRRTEDDLPVVLEGFGDPWELGLLDPAREESNATDADADGERRAREHGVEERRARLRCRLRRLAIFDILANNTDRKAGHVLHGAEGGLHAIDNGLCFSAEMKLRTVIWDFAGQELTDDEIAALWTLIDEVPPEIAELLSAEETRALRGRARWLAAVGELPGDATGMLFPWPLI